MIAVSPLVGRLLVKCMTETFFAKVVVYSLSEVSKNTSNSLDDKLVSAVAQALNVSLE